MNTQIESVGQLTPAEVLDDVLISVSLDASSSMRGVQEETRKAANDYIAELQSGTPVRFSLNVFASDVKWRITEEPVDVVKPLTAKDYTTYGSTALYDSIGESIMRIELMDTPPVHPVIVIFTDGEDECSKTYNAKTLKPMIDERRKRGWRFIVFMVGKSARVSSEKIGILPEDMAEYAGNAASTKAAFKQLAKSTKRLVEAVEMKMLPPTTFLDN